jgi:hypothetical protein
MSERKLLIDDINRYKDRPLWNVYVSVDDASISSLRKEEQRLRSLFLGHDVDCLETSNRKVLIREINRYDGGFVRRIKVSPLDAPIKYLQGMRNSLKQQYNKTHTVVQPEHIQVTLEMLMANQMTPEETAEQIERCMKLVR